MNNKHSNNHRNPGYVDNNHISRQRKRISQDITSQLKKKLSKLTTMPLLELLDKEDIDVLMRDSSQDIKVITQTEQKVLINTATLQSEIEQHKDNIIWQGKRGNIEYLPEHSAIRSRGHNVKVHPKNNETFQLDGLDVTLSLDEMLWFANFTNRCMYKYSGSDKEIEFTRDLVNKSLSWKKSFVRDGTLLYSRKKINKACPVCVDDDVMERMAVRLNKEISKLAIKGGRTSKSYAKTQKIDRIDHKLAA